MGLISKRELKDLPKLELKELAITLGIDPRNSHLSYDNHVIFAKQIFHFSLMTLIQDMKNLEIYF